MILWFGLAVKKEVGNIISLGDSVFNSTQCMHLVIFSSTQTHTIYITQLIHISISNRGLKHLILRKINHH